MVKKFGKEKVWVKENIFSIGILKDHRSVKKVVEQTVIQLEGIDRDSWIQAASSDSLTTVISIMKIVEEPIIIGKNMLQSLVWYDGYFARYTNLGLD